MRISTFSILATYFFTACIDPITIGTSNEETRIVVDGLITTDPGPYTVRLFHTAPISERPEGYAPESNSKVNLFDNVGNSELLTETSPGIYQTSITGMKGEIGREYYIHIETKEGQIIESTPDKLNAGGIISSTGFEYEALDIEEAQKKSQIWDYFNVTVDNSAEPGSRYLRWTWEGTFKAINFPRYNYFVDQCDHSQVSPEPCSGHKANCFGNVPRMFPCNCPGVGGRPQPYQFNKYLVKVKDCTCCDCWVNEYEEAPIVAENILLSSFSKIKVATIPILNHRFADKYHVQVSVMGISKIAYEFWKAIQSQKKAAKDLFQPPFYSIPGNVFSINSSMKVYGIFYAASVDHKSLFIEKTDIPRNLDQVDTLYYAFSCLNLSNSSNQKPSFWK